MRPENLGTVFGQDHLLGILSSWIENPSQTPQSLLISGPYGVGKTTIARILAKNLISSATDFIEINAADTRGIDDARAWAESTKFSPFGAAKVYIIDELHQMTTAAQSALLKVIEEPPAHVYFFLCTTEPHKLLPQIRSRCTSLQLQLFSESSTLELLTYNFPKIPLELKKEIHKKSEGHARDAMKLAQTASDLEIKSIDQLDIHAGFSYGEVYGLFHSAIAKEISYSETVNKLFEITDDQLITSVLGKVVLEAMRENVRSVMASYKEILEVQALRKEWKISGQQEALYFFSRIFQDEV